MNIEELRLIVGFLSGVETSVVWVILTWFAVNLLHGGALVLFFVWLINRAFTFFTHLSNKDTEETRTRDRATRLRDKMGVGSSGPLTTSEFNQMIRWIEEHK